MNGTESLLAGLTGVVMVAFIATYAVLLDIRSQLRRLNEHMDAEKRAARYERLFGKEGQ